MRCVYYGVFPLSKFVQTKIRPFFDFSKSSSPTLLIFRKTCYLCIKS